MIFCNIFNFKYFCFSFRYRCPSLACNVRLLGAGGGLPIQRRRYNFFFTHKLSIRYTHTFAKPLVVCSAFLFGSLIIITANSYRGSPPK